MTVAVFTDSNDRVQRIHSDPDSIDTSDGYIVDSRPSPPTGEPWIQAELYYTEADGYTYQKTDPFEGLNFTQSEKKALFEAVLKGDLVEIRTIIENATSN